MVGQEREALLRQMLALEDQKAEIERQIDDLARQISEKEVVAEELQERQERARRELTIGNLEAEVRTGIRPLFRGGASSAVVIARTSPTPHTLHPTPYTLHPTPNIHP